MHLTSFCSFFSFSFFKYYIHICSQVWFFVFYLPKNSFKDVLLFALSLNGSDRVLFTIHFAKMRDLVTRRKKKKRERERSKKRKRNGIKSTTVVSMSKAPAAPGTRTNIYRFTIQCSSTHSVKPIL